MEDKDKTTQIIKNLLKEQLFSVLSTKMQEESTPYSSLIGYLYSDDLRHIYFVTSRNTTKFTNLLSDPVACIFVDNRSNHEDDVLKATTATILGDVEEIEKETFREITEQLEKKYPQLEEFINKENTALLRLNVKQYVVVFEFQKVLRLEIT